MKLLAITFFGVLGVWSRYFIESLFTKNQLFPYSTLFINLAGCLFAGMIYGAVVNKVNQDMGAILLVGLCGGLTTFSGYALQSLNLLSKGEILMGALYLIVSPSLGVMLILLGTKLSKIMFSVS
jgi:CrcB protein